MRIRVVAILLVLTLVTTVSGLGASAEGQAVSGEACGYTVSLQIPGNWMDVTELETDSPDGMLQWGAIEDGAASILLIYSSDVWSEMGSESWSNAYGFQTRYDCEMMPDTELGDTMLRPYIRDGRDTQYRAFGGVWYIQSDADYETTIDGRDPYLRHVIYFVTTHEGVQYALIFSYDVFDEYHEAEMYEVMESVCYTEGAGIEN